MPTSYYTNLFKKAYSDYLEKYVVTKKGLIYEYMVSPLNPNAKILVTKIFKGEL